MPSIAQAATTRLSDAGKAYIYIFEGRGWCGAAGCPLLIGEMGRDGICRVRYDAFGNRPSLYCRDATTAIAAFMRPARRASTGTNTAS